jgi:H+/Cl- antiporter ClcA
MITLRFFISWIVAAVLMYLAFYAWHGVYLNELKTLPYSRTIFFIFAAVTYILISFLLLKIYEIKLLKKLVSNIFLRGLIAGGIMGVVVFMMSRVTGVGFGNSVTLKHLLFDGTWQVIEQCIGGLVMALGQMFIYDPVLEEEAIRIHASK